jgi:peptidoglycan-N-acetylglucosamine deacetylase
MEKASSTKYPLMLRILGLGRPYFVRTPGWLKKLYPHRTWNKPGNEKIIYLSFDDGPEPLVTPFVLEQLKAFNAKASFFCIGKNVAEHPELYSRILEEGHQTGNHSFYHLNGWKTKDEEYLADILMAQKFIPSKFFRPPYGRITKKQEKKLYARLGNDMQIVMWDVLSGDFDEKCTIDSCRNNVISNARPGSIIVFHDSVKAKEKLTAVLPGILEYFTKKGYSFQKL